MGDVGMGKMSQQEYEHRDRGRHTTPRIFDMDALWERLEQELVNRGSNLAVMTLEAGFSSRTHLHDLRRKSYTASGETLARILKWIGDTDIAPYIKETPTS